MELPHRPALLESVLEALDPKPGQSYLDVTAGYGGHAAAVIQRLGARGRVVLVDRDRAAIRSLSRFGNRVELIRSNFADAASDLAADGSLFDLILADVGVSSPQLDSAERGFSFDREGPLDMRQDQNQPLTAAEVVNGYSEKDLADLLYRFGEERRSRSVAKAIVRARPLTTTTQLAGLIRRVVGRSGKIDPATRAFQAIRIEVNGELEQLSSALPLLVGLLSPGGRLAVITFHSLEDRLVKDYFRRESRDCICPPRQPICTCDHQAQLRLLNRRVISGTLDRNNPRARSAKLRAVEKINQNQKEGK